VGGDKESMQYIYGKSLLGKHSVEKPRKWEDKISMEDGL
jgi:hypothetical protein